MHEFPGYRYRIEQIEQKKGSNTDRTDHVRSRSEIEQNRTSNFV